MTQQTEQPYLPPMGRTWLLPLYDPFTRITRVGRIHEQLLDRADLRAGQRVLEIGCGTGNVLTALARRGPAVDATGIDPDQGALKRARRKAARRKLPITYQRAYAGALPLPDESFDRVLSSLMLHHLGDDERARALLEVKRVLRPGGQLHVADLVHMPGRGRGRHGSARDEILGALHDAGLNGVAETGRGAGHFGGVVFYSADR
ncbi:class I SAM-dependent methyltransferase [Actinoplanes sp. TBRC 11911]|uniref:class I SAM-dependent methyltransferase n=1 Tax=Actinoplanes sp. TBRC 11911 TaxID=2729386 RepID=UPI00145EC14D|nr:class I SAM-dependent methyltransferase [Actinoplanes sp. TBRC 11911]NMO55699.1 class I SAM-dependent methyltransferase [Actinoplanes sp. TBRC 11911]